MNKSNNDVVIEHGHLQDVFRKYGHKIQGNKQDFVQDCSQHFQKRDRATFQKLGQDCSQDCKKPQKNQPIRNFCNLGCNPGCNLGKTLTRLNTRDTYNFGCIFKCKYPFIYKIL